MKIRHDPTDLSQAIFSLPFATSGSPFALTEKEKKFKADDWAWLFLRQNPLYKHDYALWLRLKELKKEFPGRFRSGAPVVPMTSGALSTSVPAAYRDLDSRHFVLQGTPLGGSLNDWTVESETLGIYLDQHQEIDLKAIRIRELDAPGDYGIGAWLDPATLQPQELPTSPATGRGSWFYHVNEPIWEVQSSLKMRAVLLSHELPDGQSITFGRDHYARHGGVQPINRTGQVTLPNSSYILKDLTPTQLRFLVCLDGYVRPQLTQAFLLASEMRELCKIHLHGFTTGSSRAVPPKIGAPLTPAAYAGGLFSGLYGPAVRVRKHWCAVTVDVAGPLGEQREQVEALLIKKQEALADELTFPIRQRSPNEGALGDNPLKRALCVIELRKHGDHRREHQPPMSWGNINSAIYCNDTPDYYRVRGQDVPVHVKLNRGGVKQLGQLEHVRASLALGRGMTQGWYELLASTSREDLPRPR